MQEKDKEKKVALRETNRLTAKDFINMRRGKLKEEKNNSATFSAIRTHIANGDCLKFQEAVMQSKPEAMLTFLFSEDELKQTPVMQIVKSEHCSGLLKVANRWSAKFSDLIVKEIYMEDNELKSSDYRAKFQNLNKLILEVFNERITTGSAINEEILLLGEKDSLFYHLCKNFLKLELIISSLNNLKTKNNLLAHFYCQLLGRTDMKELEELASQVNGYQSILTRDILWSNVDANIVKGINLSNIELLTLVELGYNIWHEFANTSAKEFFKTCEAIANQSLGEQLNDRLWKMLLEVDSSGEIATDKCLRLWSYSQIHQLMVISNSVENIMLSTNCLAKIFRNRKLKQAERQSFISEFLQGEIAAKGYIKVLPKMMSKLQNGKNVGQVLHLEIKPQRFTYNICYDKLQVKKQQDSCGDYPLITYLRTYRGNCSLKTVQQLFLEAYSRKYAKKMSLLLKKTLQVNKLVENNSQKMQEIEQLFDYYQPLWMIITHLPHGDLLEFLMSKIYTNCNEIHIKKKYAFTEVKANGLHFIAHYIRNNPFLGEDSINKGLIQGIINCKESQKTAGKYGLTHELIRSLVPMPLFHTSQEYLIGTLRAYIKQQVLSLDTSQLLARRQIWDNFVLMDCITKSLSQHQPTILTESQFALKFSPQFLKDSPLKDYFDYSIHSSKAFQKTYKQYFQTLFRKHCPQQLDDDRQQNLSHLSIKNIFEVQEHYLYQYPKNMKNVSFFNGLKNYLSSITEIQNATETFRLKFYSFRLRPEEKFLTYKFKRLLMLGIDPYFSKYSKSDYKFQEEEPRWGRLMRRMVEEKCTFMFAFITDQATDFSEFQQTFQAAISEGKESAWIGWSLPRKIHDLFFHLYRHLVFIRRQDIGSANIKQPFYFVKHKPQPLNFAAIVFILFLADKQGFPLHEYFTFLFKTFQLNLHERIRQIDNLSQLQDKDSQQLAAKKKHLQEQIEEWKSFIVSRLQREQQRFKEQCRDEKNPLIQKRQSQMAKIENQWQDCYMNLLWYTFAKMEDCLWSLIKNKKLKDIPYRYHLFLLGKESNPFHQLSSYFQGLPGLELTPWLGYLVRQQHNKLVTLFKRFSLIEQQQMLNMVVKAINHSLKQREGYQPMNDHIIPGSLEENNHLIPRLELFFKIILESISPENAPEIVRFIQDDKTLLIGKERFIKKMLHTTTNIKLISLDLLVVDRSKNTVFCIDFQGQKKGKLRQFSSVNFYSKCNDEMFSIYLQTLIKHYQLSKHLPQHLKCVVNSLVEGKLWTRLSKIFEINGLRQLTARLIIRTLYIHLKDAKYVIVEALQSLISSILAYFKSQSKEFDEDLFVASHFFNYKQAFAIFKPTSLSIYGFKNCIKAHPESSRLFLTEKVALNIDYLPVELYQLKSNRSNARTWFPIHTHSGFDRKPWLVDVIELELMLLNTLKAPRLILKSLQSCCHRREILMRKQAILTDLINDHDLMRLILRNKSIESLDMYRQFILNMDSIVKEELIRQFGSKKGNCINLNALNPKLLKYLITQKYFVFKEKVDMFSCFLRVMDTADLELLDLFIKVNKITVNIAFFKEIQASLSLSLWDHLLCISNQSFVSSFISQYQLFEIYSKDQCSPKLLNSICRFRRNKLLQFTIRYFQAKTGKKAVFVAQSLTNKPCISQNAVFFMPIQESIDSNYYETYFLITGCNNVCPMFNVSIRFLSYAQQDEWNFIPEMKRRVELNNAFMKCLYEASEMKFRQDVLLPSIFQLQKMRRKKRKVAQEPLRQKSSAKGYTESLRKFIFGLTNKSLSLTAESGSFQKLCFMIFKSAQTKIPQALIEKKYPAQMKIISSIRKFLDDQEVNLSLTELFAFVPEFKSLLLIYNPEAFLSNPEYLSEIMGQGDGKLDFSEYLRGIQINFIQFEAKYFNVLKRYIENYFFKSSIPIGNPKASLHLTREALVLLFLEIAHYERKWQQCPIFNICKREIQRPDRLDDSPQEILYDLSMNLNIRGNGDMAFDLMGWNKIIAEIEEIQSYWKSLGRGSMKEYSFNSQQRKSITGKYSEIIAKKEEKYSIINLNEVLNEIYDQHIANCNKKGALIELSLILNSFLLINDIKVLDDKLKSIKGGSSIQKYNITLVKAIQNEVSFDSPTKLSIEVKYSIEGHQSKQLSLLIVDYQATIQKLQHSLYYSDFLQHSQVQQVNAFCAKADRQPFLKNYKFRYAVSSFSSVSYESLLNLLEHGNWKNDGVVGKMLYEMQKMEERLIGTKNIKVYSTSDIYGPINFSDEVENEKIIDCLGFYELIQLPKEQEISIVYADKNAVSPRQRNLTAIKQLKSYLQYYIALAKDQVPSVPQMGSEVCVSIRKEKGEERVELDWWKFGGWTVCEVYCLVLNYCSDLSSKIQKILDVRVSFQSLIQYYEKYLEVGQGEGLKVALQRLLFQKGFNRLVESIIIMITEDVGNIMKIVKGIIIRWDINSSSKKRANIVISEFASAVSVGYMIKDQLLYITINLDMKKQLNVGLQSEDCTILVDRKEFLDSVFTSAQFLTDYFLMRNQLNTACLNISTSLTNRLNSTVNFHIQYGNLYTHVDKMREGKTIKDIESFLLRLRQYLLASMEKVLTLYLNSQELANQHQVFLLNKCESINRNVTYDAIQGAKTLEYDSLEIQPKSGLFQTNALMGEIGNEQAIKSTFLIQIFKSYYTTMVGEGMTFVVGYKSGKRKAQVIKITKAENINLINILELDYIMLVSRNLPTTDELNHSKIIRIFLTDSNRNLYRLAEPLANYFLELPDQHDDRSLAHFAPLIPSNIRLAFYEANQREKDPRDIKTFFIDLSDSKFKLAPLPDRPLTPLNSCKKSYEFKESIGQLQRGLNKFCTESMKIVIDLPQEFTEKYIGVNFSHIVHLVGSDILQFLLKWQFQPMRNASLDCKLSVEKKFMVNKNSVIQLRKRTFLAYFRSICISVRDQPSKISFKGKEITVSIDTSNMATLPSSSQYLSAILDNILSKQKSSLPKFVRFDIAEKNESTEVLLKEFDLINCIPYQIEEIQTAITLIKLFFGHKIDGFGIHIQKKKTQVRFQEGIHLHLNVESGQREFYSAEDLIRLFIANRNKGYQPNTKSQTYFDFLNKSIILQDSIEEKYTLAYIADDKQWHVSEVTAVKDHSKMIIPLPKECENPSRYYLLQSLNIYSNYTFDIDHDLAITDKNSQGIRGKPKILYLQSQKEVNLNFTNINVTETNPLFKDITNNFNILQKTNEKNIIEVHLLSKNLYSILFKYGESMILNLNYAGHVNPLNLTIDSTRLIISSDGALCLDNTKFLELQGYKRKPVLIKERENEAGSHEFRESHEQASQIQFQSKPGDANNIENLVYVVNDQCKKFLTRAGEYRVDYLQLCDADNNPIDYKQRFDVKFVHINRLAVVEPQIFRRGMQFGLRWTPTIRGHYYIYINGTRMSPPYEIGVCAGQADYKKTITTLPKIQKLCYCEESELMLDLRDSFGNLYTQLQEDIIGDSLIIEMRCSNMAETLKIDKTPINKYGLKKLKFSFNNGDAQAPSQVVVQLYLNCEFVCQFSLTIQGLSLKQRKKMLDKDISLSSKNYYKDITVNRNKFLEELFTIAEKSLHTNLSVKFTNEPGIDAGGVKREFYDMVGNEIKSQRNPFFKLINPNTMEYFLNPEILRNKKKLEYMQLWGKYLANSFLNGYLIGVSFSPVFVKLLYDQTINFQDLLSVLPADQRKQYEYLLTAAPEDFEDLDLYFTVMVDKKKCVEVELLQGGKSMQVKAENVKQYLQCTAQVLLTDRYREIIIAFRKGFETVLELAIFKKWIRNTQFWCLTAGNKELTAQLVLNYIVFQGSNIDNISGWFRRFINQATPEILIGFLKFSSGSSSIDFSLASKVTVTFENNSGENPKKLPISHTCWKEIVVPKYKNYDIMKKLLTAAFIYCSEGFGFG